MDHSQAVEQMAAERYLLNELEPRVRDAFEEHVFDCAECALDLRAAAAFVDEAKAQLPALTKPLAARLPAGPTAARMKRTGWSFLWRPGFVVPAFASLLLVVGYQNLVTMPGLRSEADQPRLLAWAPLHGATRGGAETVISADRVHGVALPVDIFEQTGGASYSSYSLVLSDAQGKVVWSGTEAVQAAGDQRLMLAIPAAMLRDGDYALAIYGVGPQGERTAVDRYVFNLRFKD